MGLPEDIAATLAPALKDQLAAHHADIIANAGNIAERMMAERYFPGLIRAVPDMLAAAVASQEAKLRQTSLWDVLSAYFEQGKT